MNNELKTIVEQTHSHTKTFSRPYKRDVFAGKNIRIGGMCQLVGTWKEDNNDIKASLYPRDDVSWNKFLNHYKQEKNKNMLSWFLEPGLKNKLRCYRGNEKYDPCYTLQHKKQVMILGYGIYGTTESNKNIHLRFLSEGKYDCFIQLDRLIYGHYSLLGL